MRVLVTDGDSRAALAATRALGRRGHTVVVGEKRNPALAQTSRYCAERIVYPDPVGREMEFIDFLAAVVAREEIEVLLPIADISTCLVVERRGRFEPGCHVPLAASAAIARAADKVDLVRTAARIGVPVPRTWFHCSPGQSIDEDLPYPVVIKPHRSRVRTAAGWKSCSVGYALTPDQLQAAVRARGGHEFPLMLQERVVGPGLGVFVCYDRGRLIASFAHRRLREKPPWGGVSVLAESTPMPADAFAYAEGLMRELQWHGVAMVEFKRDLKDGQPKLMEVNGRFWGSLQLAVDAGVDFPNILLETCRDHGAAAPAPPEYRIGVRSRWFWGDLDALLLRLRCRKQEWLPQDGRGRLGAVAQFLRILSKDLYYDNPRRDDVMPWLFETRNRLWPRR